MKFTRYSSWLARAVLNIPQYFRMAQLRSSPVYSSDDVFHADVLDVDVAQLLDEVVSGGQKQRLSIVCGFMSGREVLVFDEPTSGLDGENMRIVASAFWQAAADGKAVLVITHDTELVNLCGS